MKPDEIAEVRFRLVDVDCTSASCNVVLSRHLGNAPGIVEFYVNPLDSMLTVGYDPRRTTVDEVAAVVRATGYRTIGPIMARGRPPGGHGLPSRLAGRG